MSRGAAIRLGVLFGAVVIAAIVCHRIMIVMPGHSFAGPLPAATEQEQALAVTLAADIEELAGRIGARNRAYPVEYRAAADYIERRLRAMGYEPWRQPSPPHDPIATPGNILIEIPGSAPIGNGVPSDTGQPNILVIGAHYDSFDGSPGANDNATGVAALLALAQAFAPGQQSDSVRPTCTLRFGFFVDEEPPFFQTEEMGSLTYARACRAAGESLIGMISVETVGWYSDEPESQKYPAGLGALYPSTGNFVGFVGNPGSRAFLRQVIAAFRETTSFPSEGAALPGALPGISWSDQWSFWQEGYSALMVTDSAPFRYPFYHTAEDTPDKVDFERLSRVVAGLERVIRHVVAR